MTLARLTTAALTLTLAAFLFHTPTYAAFSPIVDETTQPARFIETADARGYAVAPHVSTPFSAVNLAVAAAIVGTLGGVGMYRFVRAEHALNRR